MTGMEWGWCREEWWSGDDVVRRSGGVVMT